MFTIPKPDKLLRSIIGLRELNKRIKRKQGLYLAMSLDLNMGYHHIKLTPYASSLFIVLPCSKYEYLRLKRGLCNSPDTFQEKMSELMLAWNLPGPTLMTS